MSKPTSFHVWSYRKPEGHSKSRAVRAGYAPMVEQWAYALVYGDVINTSMAVSGFATQADAEAAALTKMKDED